MPVVTAGVHLARHGRFIGKAGFLLERQRVHVRAQANHLGPCLAAANDADHARSPDARNDLIAAKTLKLVGNRGRRAMHVVEEFRMRVQVPPPGSPCFRKASAPK